MINRILQIRDIYSIVRWPDYIWENNRFSCNVVEKQIVGAIAEAWDCTVDSILEVAQRSGEDIRYSAVIGSIEGESVEMDVDIINTITT